MHNTKRIRLKILASAIGVLGLGALALNAAAPAKPAGFINFRTYAGDQRAGIRAGTAVPDGSYYPKRMEGPYNGWPGPDSGDDDTLPVDIRENYNMELIGYFYPPKTGKVQFAICTDDPGELWFSTDDNPANKVKIANESQWNPKRAFGGGDPSAPTRRAVVDDGKNPSPRPENWSQYFDVVAGKPYFIQSIGTEFGGGDNNAVAFRYDGDPDFQDADHPIPGQYLSPFTSPTAPTIVAQPKDAAVYDGNTATFAVVLDIAPTVNITSIKWTKNGTDVPNSNSLALSLTAKKADHGAKYKATIVTSAGTLTTSEATLLVATLTANFAPGVVKFEAWKGIGSTSVQTLLDDPHYQDPPDDVRLLGAIDTPNGYAENYGARVSGFIIPAESGQYEFFIRSDDASQLFLSTNETPPDPAAESPICEETGCCDAFHPSGDPETSAPISLVAGKKYAFIAFVKEGGGGDYLQVAMRKVGSSAALAPVTGSLIGANSKPDLGDPQVTKQPPATVQFVEGQSGTLTVDGIVTPSAFNYPVLVQWQKNGANIAGAIGKTLTIAKVTKTDAGTYRAVLSAPSGNSVNSTDVAVTVLSDTTPPTVASANRSFTSNTKVLVTFSEVVSSATANVAANYKINNGITVTAAALSANGKIVELTTSTIAAGSKNQLTVSGVQDTFGNTITANSTIDVGVQKGIYFVTADPGPLTYAGDIAVSQHLTDRGYYVEVARGSDVPDDGSTALGKDLIIESSSLGSGTVEISQVGKFRTLPIPAMDWEASSQDAFAFQAQNGTTTGGQTQLNILDPTHPLAAGFPKGLVTVTTAAEPFSQGTPTGAHVVATLANDPSQAIIYGYEKGDKGEAGFVMPARRVFFYFGDNTAAVSNDNGWKLFDAAVDWLLGIQAAAPRAQFTKITKNADGTITVEWTGGGTLQSAQVIAGPWQDVAGANSPYTFKPSGAALFGRIKQ